MGTLWPKSSTVERHAGSDAAGAVANFYVGGTTTPLAVYEDAAESSVHETDVTADANGRWPDVFIPYCASYDVQGSTSDGTQLFYSREIPNLDPVEAAEDTVDANALISTGRIIFDPVNDTATGYVRANGRSIGSASSGATERANADTSDLYTRYWNAFSNSILAVTTGRGASAAADFAANKAMALFDLRGATLRGLDDMGNTAASLLGLATFTTGDAITGGSICGANTHVLTEAQLAAHTHAISITSAGGGAHSHTVSITSSSDGSHNHTLGDENNSHNHVLNLPTSTSATAASGGGTTALWQATTSGATGNQSANHQHTVSSDGAHTHTISGSTASQSDHTHLVSGTSASAGSGTAHNNVSKSVLGSWLIKL